MASTKIGRRNCLPVIYVRGTHYDVGFDIGRTFASLIDNLVSNHKPLNETYLPLYETAKGKEVYEDTLKCVEEKYPQYVRELKGTADGAKISFHKLFLLHLDDILPNVVQSSQSSNADTGCSTVCCNQPQNELLGHTEDALAEVLNNIYIVNAHITDSTPNEVFTSLCYAGCLPGFTMSYNQHGLVYSINVISAKRLEKGKIPRSFLTRALLSAKSLVQVEDILRASGCGAADALSVNLTFLKQEGDRLFHNIEVSPANPPTNESGLSVLTVSPGEFTHHFNRFLRLNAPEQGDLMINSSTARKETADKLPAPVNLDTVITFLSDDKHPKFNIFRDKDDFVKTVAVGIFDCVARTWSIYIGNPEHSEPIAVLPIVVN